MHRALVWMLLVGGVLGAVFDAPVHAADEAETVDLEGVVVGVGVGPLRRVEVFARIPRGVRVPHGVHPATVTDADGRFRISGLPRSEYRLRFARPNRAPVELGPFGEDAGPLRIELDVGGVIRGHVLAGDGGGVPGLHVRAAPPSGKAPYGASLWPTDTDGEFVVTDLERGATYDLTTSVLPRAVDSVAPAAVATLAGVRADGEPARIAADVGLALDGIAVDVDGRLLAGAVVWANPRSGAPESFPALRSGPRATTDRNGRFRMVQVPHGRYRMAISDIDGRQVTVETRGGEDVVGGTRGLRLVADTAGGITGAVVDESGQGLLATVWAIPSGADTPLRQVSTGVGGAFRMTGLDVRWAYRLVASVPGRVPAARSAVRVGSERERLVLCAGLPVTGRVEFEDGRSVANMPLYVESIGPEAADLPNAQEGKTDADGRFRVTGLRPGPVRVVVGLSDSRTRTTTSGSAEGDAGGDVTVVVTVDGY